MDRSINRDDRKIDMCDLLQYTVILSHVVAILGFGIYNWIFQC